MKKFLSGLIGLTSKIIPKRYLEKILIFSAKSIHIDLRQHALLQIGAGTNVYLENGSELFFIKNILAKQFENGKVPLVFDVGANVGNYTLDIKKYLPGAEVLSFEPVKETFEHLKRNIGDTAGLYNVGFGNTQGKGILYNSVNATISEISTMHKGILNDVFKNGEEIEEIEFAIDTIDNFCVSHNISSIDFLKIDVEGNELSVLQGASEMLANQRIKIVQFEFNSHNIYSRVFLRDFYLLLNDFELFRLISDGMLCLGKYDPINEIFTAQNLVAVHQKELGRMDTKYIRR